MSRPPRTDNRMQHSSPSARGTQPNEILSEKSTFPPHGNSNSSRSSLTPGNNDVSGGGGKDSRQSHRGNYSGGRSPHHHPYHGSGGMTNVNNGGHTMPRGGSGPQPIPQHSKVNDAISMRGGKGRTKPTSGNMRPPPVDNGGNELSQISRVGVSNNHKGHLSGNSNLSMGATHSMGGSPTQQQMNYCGAPSRGVGMPSNTFSIIGTGGNRSSSAIKSGSTYLVPDNVANFNPGHPGSYGTPARRGVISSHVGGIPDVQQQQQEMANSIKQGSYMTNIINGMHVEFPTEMGSIKGPLKGINHMSDLSSNTEMIMNNNIGGNGGGNIVLNTPAPSGSGSGNSMLNSNNSSSPAAGLGNGISGVPTTRGGKGFTSPVMVAVQNRPQANIAWSQLHATSGTQPALIPNHLLQYYPEQYVQWMISQQVNTNAFFASSVSTGPQAATGGNINPLNEQIAINTVAQANGSAIMNAAVPANVDALTQLSGQIQLSPGNNNVNEAGSPPQPPLPSFSYTTLFPHGHHVVRYDQQPVAPVHPPPSNLTDADSNNSNSASTPANTVHASTASSPTSYDDETGAQGGITYFNNGFHLQSTSPSYSAKHTSHLSNAMYNEPSNNSPSHQAQTPFGKMYQNLQHYHFVRLTSRIYED